MFPGDQGTRSPSHSHETTKAQAGPPMPTRLAPQFAVEVSDSERQRAWTQHQPLTTLREGCATAPGCPTAAPARARTPGLRRSLRHHPAALTFPTFLLGRAAFVPSFRKTRRPCFRGINIPSPSKSNRACSGFSAVTTALKPPPGGGLARGGRCHTECSASCPPPAGPPGRQQVAAQVVGPCLTWRPRWRCGLLVSAWPSPAVLGVWGVNQQTAVLSLPFKIKINYSIKPQLQSLR